MASGDTLSLLRLPRVRGNMLHEVKDRLFQPLGTDPQTQTTFPVIISCLDSEAGLNLDCRVITSHSSIPNPSSMQDRAIFSLEVCRLSLDAALELGTWNFLGSLLPSNR